jgi:hypothetical protein
MNPYAAQLGAHDPFEVIRSTPGQLERLWITLGPDRRSLPRAPGKWSPREILCHLADVELADAFRLRQALAEDHHVIQPYDQERWARQYPAYDGTEALSVFTAVRRWNLALVGSVVPAALARPVSHPERGEMTFQELIETMAGHDLNHVRQLEAIVSGA